MRVLYSGDDSHSQDTSGRKSRTPRGRNTGLPEWKSMLMHGLSEDRASDPGGRQRGREEVKAVGVPVPHLRGEEIVSGALDFVTDLELPNMVYGRVLRSPIPHGKIVRMDVQKAKRVPGVIAIVTARDAPREKFG